LSSTFDAFGRSHSSDPQGRDDAFKDQVGMKMTRFAPLALTAAMLTACGSDSPDAETSRAASLVGGIGGVACTQYSLQLGDASRGTYKCSGFDAYDSLGASRGREEILFLLDPAFTAAQRSKIEAALDIAMTRVGEHFKEKYVERKPLSNWQTCVKRNTTRNLEPRASRVPGRDVDFYSDIMAGGVTILGNFHAQRNSPALLTPITFAPTSDGTYILARAVLGSDYLGVGASQDMNINLNTVALDAEFTAETFAGSIFHEWMHRIGFDHPDGYEGSMIKEAGLCIASHNTRMPGTSLVGPLYVDDVYYGAPAPVDPTPNPGSSTGMPRLASLGLVVDNANHRRPADFASIVARGVQMTQSEHQCAWAVRPLIYVFADGVIYAERQGNDYNVFDLATVRRHGCALPSGMDAGASAVASPRPSLASLGIVVDNRNHTRPGNFESLMAQGRQLSQAEHACSWAVRPLIYAFADGVVYANFQGNDYNVFDLDTVRRHGCRLP
jgi:hypothetical protein